MAVKRKFTFPMSTLLYEADLIITAAESQAAFASKRLPERFVDQLRTKLAELGGQAAAKQAQAAKTGQFTQQQNDAVVHMLDLFGKVKETAKLAFDGQEVKLHKEFQVGVNSPNDLGAVLQRAGTVLTAAKTQANADALKDKGWLASDTTDLENAIKQVGNIDKSQQNSQHISITGTDDRNTAANELYDKLLTIQNAADIEWPEKKNNRGSRDAFRLDSFPPSGSSAKAASAPTAPSAPGSSPAPSPAPPK